MNGLLLIDKPSGWSSHDVVNKVRNIIEKSGITPTPKKRFPVGHAGTLDPEATGLLILLLGDHTKKAAELSKLDKTYAFSVKLGQTSTTGDEEGIKTSISDHKPEPKDVTQVVHQFIGPINQIPPAYSAIKINGRPAYKWARSGQALSITPRQIHVYELSVTDYHYPYIDMLANVSSGTYIRSLAEDIGSKLKTGAYASSIRRLTIDRYSVDDAINLDGLNTDVISRNLKKLD